MPDYQYFEDFTVGATYKTAPITLTEPEIVAFAKQFDPQPMHTDPQAAIGITGGLIASGWHTASLTMRLLIAGGGYNPAPGTLGGGVEQLKWLKPVRPGDSIHLQLEVTNVRGSESKPGTGIVTIRLATLNQRNETVQEMTTRVIVPKRNATGKIQ